MVNASLSESKVDIGHFKMIVDYYERKCPCWGGKHSCPCPPFAETRNCRCGAVRAMNDPKAQKPTFETYKIDFSTLAKVINNGHICPEEKEKTCFCGEFLESGKCKLNMFEKLGNPP